MATILLWYHTAATKDANGHGVPVIEEPSLNADDVAEQITTPATSAPAPIATEFAVIETDADVRYTVRGQNKTTPDATALHKKITVGQNQISLHEGQTIHFIDA